MEEITNKDKIITTEGPPFTTGDYHYGHVGVGLIKAIIDKIFNMKNKNKYNVEKVVQGYDTNGVNIETIIEKNFQPKNTQEKILLCKNFVEQVIKKWESLPSKLKRNIDVKNYWATYHDYYMQSVWWAFKELYKKGLIYESKKVCQYSPGIGTNISNSEAKENSGVVPVNCVTFSYTLENFDAKIIVWTTTPWTIPSNKLCAVGENIEYVYFDYEGDKYIISNYAFSKNKDKVLHANFNKKNCKVLNRFNGKYLTNFKYKSLFEYNIFSKNTIHVADFVDEEKGTGFVHIADAFGLDDFTLCKKLGFVDEDAKNVFDPLDEKCNFTELCGELKGKFIFDKTTTDLICQMIKNKNNLCVKSTIQKETPLCPRTDLPIISRTARSLFIKTTSFKDKMLEFVRNHVSFTSSGNIRMEDWLLKNVDWDFARNNKEWGNPIPLWRSNVEGDDEIYIPDSFEDLKERSGQEINNFFKSSLDKLTIMSKKGNKMERYPALFDCWFESGCAPFACKGYPHNHSDVDFYPMDYVAESQDQIRGWFYSLLVFSTSLFNIYPYKKVFLSGMILASNGKKMSKRLNNYEPFDSVLEKNGIDAVTLYITNSPFVEGGNFLFNSNDISDCNREVVNLFKSCKNFLEENITLYEKNNDVNLREILNSDKECKNDCESKEIFDLWLFSITKIFCEEMRKKYDNFSFKNVKNIIQEYINNVNNWYIKLTRNTFKGYLGNEKAFLAIKSLNTVLNHVAFVIKPFMPETSKYIKHSEDYDYKGNDYYREFPYDEKVIEENIFLVKLVSNIRDMRDKLLNKNSKYPIDDIKFYTSKDNFEILKKYQTYLKYEINSNNLSFLPFKSSMVFSRLNFNFKTFLKTYNKSKNFKSVVKDYKTDNNNIPDFNIYQRAFDTEYELREIDNNNFYNRYLSDIETIISINKNQETELQKTIYELRCLFSNIQKMRSKTKLHPWDNVYVESNSEYFDRTFLESLIQSDKYLSHNKDLVKKLYKVCCENKLKKYKFLLEEKFEMYYVKIYVEM